MAEIITDEELQARMAEQVEKLRSRGFLAGPEDLTRMVKIFEGDDGLNGDPLVIGPRDELSLRRMLKEIENGGSDD